jgi:hypothetical protein
MTDLQRLVTLLYEFFPDSAETVIAFTDGKGGGHTVYLAVGGIRCDAILDQETHARCERRDDADAKCTLVDSGGHVAWLCPDHVWQPGWVHPRDGRIRFVFDKDGKFQEIK